MRPSFRGVTTATIASGLGAALAVTLLTACSGGGEATYVPTALPLDRILTAEEEASIAETNASLATAFGITDPPAVEIVRLTSAASNDQAIIDCMTAAGFPPTEAGQPGWFFPAAQAKAGGLARYTCGAQYPADPAQDYAQLTPEQLHLTYQYVTDTLVGCLKDHGVTITTTAPTEDTFTKTFGTANEWSPYKSLGRANEALTQACPSYPAPELIWGK